MDEESHEPFSDRLNMVFLDLAALRRRSLGECENQVERWFFLIKNLENMKEKPKEYPMFDQLFEVADLSHLANEEVVTYSESRMKLEDDRKGVEYYGQIQRMEGIKEGEKRMLKDNVKKLLDFGMSVTDIAKMLGYSDSFIASL